MANVFMRFPGNKPKALTLSYDDNTLQDVRLVEILRKWGLKGTFNVNAGQFAPEGGSSVLGEDLDHPRLSKTQAQKLHAPGDMEIACHGYTHAFLAQLPEPLCLKEVYQDRVELEKTFGTLVRGMAYPYGSMGENVDRALAATGICYGRTVNDTQSFPLPTNWLRWNPTCHHKNPNLMKLAKIFVDRVCPAGPYLFYLWGHSYEFDDQNNWHIIEEFAQFMANRDDIWYATNIEIYDYMQAYKQLLFSADGTRVYNPTATTLYFATGNGPVTIKPGETVAFT